MSKRTSDIRKLARRQRWMIWLVLLVILAQFSPFLSWGRYGMILLTVATLAQLAVHVLMIVGVILLVSAQGTHLVITILCGLLMVAPCGSPSRGKLAGSAVVQNR